MDIVQRLRSVFGVVVKLNECFEEDYSVAREAADEIERLRQQVEDLALVARGAAYRIEDSKKSQRFLAMIDKATGGEDV